MSSWCLPNSQLQDLLRTLKLPCFYAGSPLPSNLLISCQLLPGAICSQNMNPLHWAFDKLYPIIRFFYEKIQGHPWFSNISPQLWIGGAPTYERDFQFLAANEIDAILDMRAERSGDTGLYSSNGIDYLRIPVLDVMVPSSSDLDQGVSFIHQHVKNDNIVLVHCAKGRGRSATVLAAYLMKYENCSFQEAKDLLNSKRSLVQLQGRHERALETWIRLQNFGTGETASESGGEET